MQQTQTACYAGTKLNIVMANRRNDAAVEKTLRSLAVIPAYVEYDERIETQAFKSFSRKYDSKKSRALAYFCAMLLGYYLYGDKNLAWAMQTAEARVRI